MLRRVGLCLLAAFVLTGCGDRSPANLLLGRGSGLAMELRAPADGSGQVFSYSHSLQLLLPHGGVKANYELGRDACLHESALGCDLVSASLNTGESSDYASMVVALPHDKVAVFEKKLTDAGAAIQSRSTTAENVTIQAGDNDRKIAQLTAWRDRLAALAKRSSLSVADLMKIEAELSKAEADLSAALAEKRDIRNRIAKELVAISFSEKEQAWAPVARTFANAGSTLIDSTAVAIDFLIRIVPWIPILLAGLWLLRWLWSKRRKTA